MSVGQTSVYAVDDNGKSFRSPLGLGFPEHPDGMTPWLARGSLTRGPR